MRKQSGRWACFFEQMGDQNVHLFEGFSPSYEHSSHLLEKTSYPEGASDRLRVGTALAWPQQ